MNIEQAKAIHKPLMSLLFVREGIGECSDEEVEIVRATSLIDLLTANQMMTGYTEPYEGGARHFMHTTDEAIALLYCRLQNRGLFTVEDITSVAEAYAAAGNESHNGFGVLIDADEYCTLVELNHDGTGGEEVHYETSFSALYEWAVQKLQDSEVAA
jgi:hypothetical protein